MGKKKFYINWYWLIAGILILYFNLSRFSISKKDIGNLDVITVNLDKDIININSRESGIEYKFRTQQYKAQFNILKGSISNVQRNDISELKKGEQIDLFIINSEIEYLDSKSEEITVHGLIKDGVSLLSVDEYYRNRKYYKIRILVIALFMSIMLIANGIIDIRSKINYVIIGLFIGLIIVFRVFHIVIY